MATVTTVKVDGYAFCQQLVDDKLCPGNKQIPVQLEKDIVEHSYLDGGGDLGPFCERSQTYLRWPDPEAPETRCKHCGFDGPMAISEQVRPQYQDTGAAARAQKAQEEMAGFAKGLSFLQAPAPAPADDSLRAELAEVRAQLAALTSAPGAGAAANAGPDTAEVAAPPSRTRAKKED